MKNALILASLALAVVLVVLALILGRHSTGPSEPHSPARTATSLPPSAASANLGASHESFLHGRVTTAAGDVYEGRIRFGTDEEAFWDEFFNGHKAKNPWAEFVPPEHLSERVPIEIFGIRITRWTRRVELERPFMVRFGDIARIDVEGRELRVTLRSGTAFHLDRFGADDIADGLRVWDRERGVVDLVEWQIRRLELLPPTTSGSGDDAFPPSRALRGSVTTRDGRHLEGRLVYDLDESETVETMDAPLGEANTSILFGRIASIEPFGDSRPTVTLHDGEELRFDRAGDLGDDHGGMLIFVDEAERPAFVPWVEVDRVDLEPPPRSPSGGGPG